MEQSKLHSDSTNALEQLVSKNIDAITQIEEAMNQGRTRADTLADLIADFCGSVSFVYVHCALFAVWLIWNGSPWLGKRMAFDPPPFNMLTLVVSLEAIFLSTFILISQNHQQRKADQRNHLDLQINLLAEQESSQMLSMLKRVMEQLGLEQEPGVHALEATTDPVKVANQLSEALGETKPTA